jgi:hypothetical protein
VAVRDIQTFGAMMEGMEFVSNLVTRYAIFEKLYLQTTTGEGSEPELRTKGQLTQAIIKLYISILNYLSSARRYYDRHTAGAWICSLTFSI